MPTLRITITAPLPDDPLQAFRDRHEIEAAVLAMLEALGDEPREINVTCEVESGGLKPRDKPTEKRTRGPNKPRTPAANGAAAEAEQTDSQ